MNSKLKFILRVGLAWVAITCSIICKGEAEYEFELNGVMEIIPHRYNIPAFSCKMRVCCRDCQWAISKIWETKTNRIVQEMSDDGTNIYSLTHIEALKNTWIWTAIPNSWVAQIHRSGFPRYALQTEEAMLFYAYASTCYLDSVTNSFIDPIKFEPNDLLEGDKRVKGVIIYSSARIRLPQQLCFLSVQETRTNAVLNANNITNIGMIQIPLEVSLRRFALDDGTPLIDYMFKVDNLTQHCKIESFKVRLPSAALVSDYRFSQGQAYVPPIVESATNGWMDEATAKLQPSYKTTQLDWGKMQKERSKSLSPKATHVFIAKIFLLSAIGGGVALIAIYLRTTKHNT